MTETRLFDSRYYPESISANGALTRLWDYLTDDVGNVTSIGETLDCPAASLTLSGETVTTTELIESCGSLAAGGGYRVAAPGDVTFRAQGQVVLQDGFSVGAGGRFTAGAGVDLGFPVMTARTYAYQDYQYYLIGGDGPWGMLSWTYDGIGNRLTETRNGIVDSYDYLLNNAGGHSATLDLVSLGLGGAKDYTFGLAGHLELVDAAGNVIDFSSDAEGRLSSLSRTSASASFLYDGRSFLASSVETGTGSFAEPTYSSEGLLCSLFGSADGGATTSRRHVLYFAGRPVAILGVPAAGAETYTFLSTDHLGTPFVATDLGGGEMWAGGFEPFGADWQAGTPGGAQENGVFLRFPGQWFDESWKMAGLGAEGYYNVHRWLNSKLGRYSRPDPIGLVDAINLYSYVDSEPISGVDLLGLQRETFQLTPEDLDRMLQESCARRAFFDNYEDMIQANWKHSDKYFHCKANCEGTRCGTFGFMKSCELSNLRELADRVLKGDPPSASLADQIANRYGREEARKQPNATCQTICQRFRPKGLPRKY